MLDRAAPHEASPGIEMLDNQTLVGNVRRRLRECDGEDSLSKHNSQALPNRDNSFTPLAISSPRGQVSIAQSVLQMAVEARYHATGITIAMITGHLLILLIHKLQPGYHLQCEIYVPKEWIPGCQVA